MTVKKSEALKGVPVESIEEVVDTAMAHLPTDLDLSLPENRLKVREWMVRICHVVVQRNADSFAAATSSAIQETAALVGGVLIWFLAIGLVAACLIGIFAVSALLPRNKSSLARVIPSANRGVSLNSNIVSVSYDSSAEDCALGLEIGISFTGLMKEFDFLRYGFWNRHAVMPSLAGIKDELFVGQNIRDFPAITLNLAHHNRHYATNYLSIPTPYVGDCEGYAVSNAPAITNNKFGAKLKNDLLSHQISLPIDCVKRRVHSCCLPTDGSQGFLHNLGLFQVNDHLSDNASELQKSTYRNRDGKPDDPSIGTFVFRVLALFFGGFIIALYGACIYDQRRVQGASLIGLGTLCGAAAIAYLLLTLSYGRFTISQTKNHSEYRQPFQHNSIIVPQKHLDTL